jgi:hypothetical protein
MQQLQQVALQGLACLGEQPMQLVMLMRLALQQVQQAQQ